MRSGGRSSDVALTFDQPPGGSTIQDDAADDLPVADEVPDAEPFTGDSATLAHAPPLPDAPDYGAPAGSGAGDASSILADLAEPAKPLSEGSVVRIEAPGVGPTVSGGPLPDDILADATTTDASPCGR